MERDLDSRCTLDVENVIKPNLLESIVVGCCKWWHMFNTSTDIPVQRSESGFDFSEYDTNISKK